MQNQQVTSGNGKTVTDLQAGVTTSSELPKYYVSGCIEIEGTVGHAEDDEAEFFTLYERKENGLSHALLDCTDRLGAEAAMAVYAERDALQDQVQKLATENVQLKDIVDGVNSVLYGQGFEVAGWHLNGALEPLDNWFTDNGWGTPETPATDAAIREIGAKAVEGFGDVLGLGSLHLSLILKKCAYEHAAKLRVGEQP